MMIHKSAIEVLKTDKSYSNLEWFSLIRKIFEGKPTELAITFPVAETPIDSLKYLYDELREYGFEEKVFEIALLDVFDFYRKNRSYLEELYSIIYFFEKISLSHYFGKFSDIIFHEELYNLTHNGVNLHYLLLNIIIDNDNDKQLDDYFLKKNNQKQPPAYYQAALRYYNNYPSYNKFCFFLDSIISKIDENNINLIIDTFDEITYFKSGKYICEWFRNTKLSIENNNYRLIEEKTKEWLINVEKRDYINTDNHCKLLRYYFNEISSEYKHIIRKIDVEIFYF